MQRFFLSMSRRTFLHLCAAVGLAYQGRRVQAEGQQAQTATGAFTVYGSGAYGMGSYGAGQATRPVVSTTYLPLVIKEEVETSHR